MSRQLSYYTHSTDILDLDEKIESLREAIRRFTSVGDRNAPNSVPNGPAERACLELRRALEDGDIDRAREAYRAMSAAQADDIQHLREVAEDALGGDFLELPEGRP